MFLVEESRRGAVDVHRRSDFTSAQGLFRELACQRWRRYDEIRLIQIADDQRGRSTLAVHRFADKLPDDPLRELRRERDHRESLLQIRAADFLHRVLELKGRGHPNYWKLAKLEHPADIVRRGVAAFCMILRGEYREDMTHADLARLETRLIESAIAELEPP